MTHQPTVCQQVSATARYNGKNWSNLFACPVCLRNGRFNHNFLGKRLVVCDGSKFSKVPDRYSDLKAAGVFRSGPKSLAA